MYLRIEERIYDESVVQFIPDTRFDEYQCCKHVVGPPTILQPVWRKEKTSW